MRAAIILFPGINREGDIAPFALDSYEAARDWAEDIKRVINEGIMPPWKPVPGHGDFRGDRSLTVDEKNKPRYFCGFLSSIGAPRRHVLDKEEVFHRISLSRPN